MGAMCSVACITITIIIIARAGGMGCWAQQLHSTLTDPHAKPRGGLRVLRGFGAWVFLLLTQEVMCVFLVNHQHGFSGYMGN